MSQIGASSSSSSFLSSISEVDPNVLPPPTPSAKLEINYLHHHIITFSPDDDKKDSATALQGLTSAILSNSSGKLHQNPMVDRNENTTPSPQKVKSIAINGRTIRFTADTLPEPPVLSYKTKAELEQLVRDWTCSSLITMNGIGVPLGMWKKLYKRTRPGAWERIKDQWTKFKFIVGGFKSFDSPQEFWEAMSLPPTTPNCKIINFRKISDTLRRMRSERDAEDVEKAKAKYTTEEYQALFSYKKKGKMHIMIKPQDIARRHRLHNKELVYWDEEESEEE